MGRGKAKDVENVDGFPMKLKHKRKNGDKVFYCALRTRQFGSCLGSAVVKLSGEVVDIHRHNHDRDTHLLNVELARSSVKNIVKSNPKLTPKQVKLELTKSYSGSVFASLGSYDSLRGMVKRARPPVDSSWLKCDENPPIFTGEAAMSGDKPFHRLDTTVNGSRLVFFATDEELTILSGCDTLLLDGTFDSAPSSFSQVLTVHAVIGPGVIRPLAYGLLSSKSYSDYVRFLEALKSSHILASWNPREIVTGLRNACQSCFPHSRHHFCFFHLIKSWRTELCRYADLKRDLTVFDSTTCEFWRYAKVIPLLEARIIPAAWETIKAHFSQFPPNLISFIGYVERNYIYGVTGGSPRFNPLEWSCGYNYIDDIPRTTNALESWHKSLESIVYDQYGRSAIKTSSFVRKIEEESTLTRSIYEQLSCDPSAKVLERRKHRVLTKDKRIAAVLESCPFLQGIPVDIEYIKTLSVAVNYRKVLS